MMIMTCLKELYSIDNLSTSSCVAILSQKIFSDAGHGIGKEVMRFTVRRITSFNYFPNRSLCVPVRTIVNTRTSPSIR